MASGLSPRVRGNRIAAAAGGEDGDRSIPACAGEPDTSTSGFQTARVYPRVCGGTADVVRGCDAGEGLSPRVRGNPYRHPPPHIRHRSIPACAGEPVCVPGFAPSPRVYPRVCGGTVLPMPIARMDNGLSPRVRGNPAAASPTPSQARSIPACAGEPATGNCPRRLVRVYPRVCGGTCKAQYGAAAGRGLSPRVRGNLWKCALPVNLRWSIPACAGEPRRRGGGQRWAGVYPRVCGGTEGARRAIAGGQGLSPRVRGNRVHRQAEGVKIGSIPACAGEPYQHHPPPHRREVYPRVCGGTYHGCRGPHCPPGLSPRVRGNRGRQRRFLQQPRSIPACAGEPGTVPAAGGTRTVYPRVCGGTATIQSA